MGELFVTVLLSGLVFGFVGSLIAKNKGIVQSTGFLLGFFLGPIGLIIVALLNSSTSSRVPVSARFDGNRDVLDNRYQLWLTQKYDVTRNDTLGRYVVGGDSFGTLEEALGHADHLEDIQHDRRQAEGEHSALVKKRLMYVAAACVLGAVAIFAGKYVINYIDHRKAVTTADEAVAARREELASVLASAKLPLIPSAQMTQSDYRNGMPTAQLKELGFLTSTVERPRGEMGDSCSIGSGTIYWTDFNGKSVWFSSTDTPENVRKFYLDNLKQVGFTEAPGFHDNGKGIDAGIHKDRIEYANKDRLIFVNASRLDDGSTNVGICVLGRKEMDAALKRKNEYDRKMAALQEQSNAAQRNLERQLKSSQKFLDSFQ